MATLRRRRSFSAVVAALVLGAVLVACSNTAVPAPDEIEETPAPETPEPSEDPIAGLEAVDFGEIEWVVRPGGNQPETVQLQFTDGQATDGFAEYSIGEVILSELTDDGLLDAAVQVTIVDGNSVEVQWYLWIADENGPVQVTLPVAQAAHCGTAVHSVEAANGGGITIHETRRHIGEDHYLPCSETGTDERIRTVIATEARNEGEWWPVQVEPVGGFGGLCPIASDYESVTYSGPLHTAPDAAAAEVSGGEETRVFSVEPWPIYGEDFPGWVLVGVHDNDNMWCAWAETP